MISGPLPTVAELCGDHDLYLLDVPTSPHPHLLAS
jgi:hypothetical protein